MQKPPETLTTSSDASVYTRLSLNYFYVPCESRSVSSLVFFHGDTMKLALSLFVVFALASADERKSRLPRPTATPLHILHRPLAPQAKCGRERATSAGTSYWRGRTGSACRRIAAPSTIGCPGSARRTEETGSVVSLTINAPRNAVCFFCHSVCPGRSNSPLLK